MAKLDHKVCTQCGTVFGPTRTERWAAFELRTWCSRRCAAFNSWRTYEYPKEKRCTKCEQVKPASAFGKIKRKHGFSIRPACKECLGGERRVWRGMKERCLNPKLRGYPQYGGRGIGVCERWLKFEDFLADMGRRPSAKHQLDRIDNDGNYEPGNVRWVTSKENNRNRRDNRNVTMNGRTQTVKAWAEETGVAYSLLIQRVNRGWDLDDAIKTPAYAQYRRKETSASDVTARQAGT